jgi:hypothetical protein
VNWSRPIDHVFNGRCDRAPEFLGIVRRLAKEGF